VSEAGCISFIGRATAGRIVLGFHGYTSHTCTKAKYCEVSCCDKW